MIREAGPGDRGDLEAIFSARIDQAMFPLTNLRAHELRAGAFATDHPHATRFWVAGQSVVALTQGGMVMAVLDPDCDLATLRGLMAGQMISGAAGPASSIRPVLRALGLQDTPARLDRDELGFALDLTRLQMPLTTDVTLVPAAEVPHALLIDWRAAAMVETQGMSPAEARHQAATDVEDWLARDSHRILVHQKQPVALTGFNARLPEIVQIGGVYTPPECRNQGHARAAVALHLAEVRDQGCSRAVLFTGSPAAAMAYRAIGFQPAPDFALVLFRQPVTLPP